MANLLPILPRETVYSWIARNYLVSGFATYKSYCKFLLGTKRVRFHPFLNNRIAKLSAISGIEASELIWSHSLYPLFAILNGDQFVGRTFHYLLSDKTLPVSVFGLNQQSLFSFHGHKYCPACVETDIQKYGFHYWHINHQLPGASACAQHRCELYGLDSGDLGLDRHLALPIKDDYENPATDSDFKLAKFADEFIELSKPTSSDSIINNFIVAELTRKGLLTVKGRFRTRLIIQELQGYWQGLTPQSSNNLAVSDIILTFDYVPHMLRNLNRYNCHPIKLLLVIGWLSDCDIMGLRRFNPVQEPRISNDTSDNNTQEVNVDNVILAMLKRGVSHNEIYRQTGKSRVYIKRLASTEKLYSYTSGNKINAESCRAILRKGFYGIHRYAIAKSLSISVGSVEQILSSAPDIIRWRKALKKQITKSKYRNELRRFISTNPECCRKDIKASCNAAFFWCYNNDNEWLQRTLPEPQTPCVKKVDWPQRDVDLLARIKLIVKESPIPVSLAFLDKKVGGKKWLTKFIAMLPKTKRLLSKLIKSKKVKAQNPDKYK